MSEKGKVIKKTDKVSRTMHTSLEEDHLAYLKNGGTKFKGELKFPEKSFADSPGHDATHEEEKHWGRNHQTEET